MMSALTSKLIRPILPNVISSLRTHPYFDLGKKNIDCNFFLKQPLVWKVLYSVLLNLAIWIIPLR